MMIEKADFEDDDADFDEVKTAQDPLKVDRSPNRQTYYNRPTPSKGAAASRPTRVPRSMWSVAPEITVFLLVSFGAVMFNDKFPELIFSFSVEIFGWPLEIFVPPIWLLSATVLVRIINILHNSTKEIRRKHIRYVSGKLSYKRKEIEIPYEDIAWVNVTQTVLERIFNVGTISIGSALSDKPSVVMEGIKEPHKYSKMIYRKMAKARYKKEHHQPSNRGSVEQYFSSEAPAYLQ